MGKRGSGWRDESHRHRLAGMGISTGRIESKANHNPFEFEEPEWLKDEYRETIHWEDVDYDEHLSNIKNKLIKISQKPKVKAYRIIWVDKIDEENLGFHYSYEPIDVSVIEDLYYRFKEKYNIEKGYIIQVEIPTEDIDFQASVINNVMYPGEHEIQLKTDKNVVIESIRTLGEESI